MIVFVLVVLSLGLAGLALVFARECASGKSLPLTADWIDDCAFERYRPMMRLLDEEEIRLLRSRYGYTPKMARDLRIQRCEIFREYLSQLDADFKRISSAVKLLMAQSRCDRPDLAALLIRSQAAFLSGKVMVRIHLLQYRWSLGSVDVARLMMPFENLRVGLRSLVPAQAGVAA